MPEILSTLSVVGGQIVDSAGKPFYLRGVNLGGWMNLENFINAFPGSEHGLRAVMAEVIGPAKAGFFFDRLLDHFITEADLAFIKKQGATAVRIPLNYRHFEHDWNPFHYLEAGFARLDRVLEWCAQNGLYAILDMHAAPGWQNTDWHSDNANRNALLWEHPHFQERLIRLWIALADRYRGNPTVAGYDVINEPVTGAPRGVFTDSAYRTNWQAMNQLYRRLVAAIREHDRDHIIFLEGDFFSSYFHGLEEPFALNLVYSSHNYNPAGFGPGPYPGEFHGEYWDAARQRRVFDESEGIRFTRKHQVPLWVSEFGSVYNGPEAEIPDRLRALDDQLAVFNSAGAHWSYWTYKDAGVMGWVSLDPESEYVRHLSHILKAKLQLDTDFWLEWLAPTPVKSKVIELARMIAETIPDPDIRMPEIETYLRQASLSNFAGELLQPAYARCFKDLSEQEIDRILRSFRLENCLVCSDLIGVCRRHLSTTPHLSEMEVP